MAVSGGNNVCNAGNQSARSLKHLQRRISGWKISDGLDLVDLIAKACRSFLLQFLYFPIIQPVHGEPAVHRATLLNPAPAPAHFPPHCFRTRKRTDFLKLSHFLAGLFLLELRGSLLSPCLVIHPPLILVIFIPVRRTPLQGVPAISELAFAAEALPSSMPMAAITGTNGKSTVTTFTGQVGPYDRSRLACLLFHPPLIDLCFPESV